MSLIVRDDGPPTSVFEELGFQDRPLDTLNLFWALGYWHETRNPYYIDYVQVCCWAEKIQVGPLLQAEFVDAAGERLRRARRGLKQPSWTKVLKNLARLDYLTDMARRVRDGESPPGAARNAINKLGAGKWKRDTLVKDYFKLFKNTDFEKAFLEAYDDAFSPERNRP